MNWKEYLDLSEKTLSTQFNCDFYHQKLLHSVMGSLTEIDELLENYCDGELIVDVNKQGSVSEESADIFWYIAILFRELEIDNFEFKIDSNFKTNTPFNTLLSFTSLSLKFLDLLKKKLFYNKEISKDLMIDYSIQLHSMMTLFCQYYKADVNSILEKNINKLRARYGEKFSSDKAINRNLDIEKNILEN